MLIVWKMTSKSFNLLSSLCYLYIGFFEPSPLILSISVPLYLPSSIEICLSLGLYFIPWVCYLEVWGWGGDGREAEGGGMMDDSSMGLILAEFAMAGGTLTIEGVCRYLRIPDNGFKDPGEMFSY